MAGPTHEPPPDLKTLEEAIRQFVKNAQANGQLSSTTPRMIREALEKEFSVKPRTFEEKEYKDFVKIVAQDVVAEIRPKNPQNGTKPTSDSSKGLESKNSAKKRDAKEASTETPPTSKGKADDELTPKRKGETDKARPRVKSITTPTSAKDTVPKPRPAAKPRTSANAKVYKSKEFLATSDMEEDEKSDEESKRASTSKSSVKATAPLPRSPVTKKRKAAVLSDSDKETDHFPKKSSNLPGKSKPPSRVTKKKTPQSDSEMSGVENSPPPKKSRVVVKAEKPARKSKPTREENESGSEMSVDDGPSTKGKSKGSKAAASTKQTSRKSKTNGDLSKDEQTLTRLKQLINTCGVRKQWAREFKDLPEASDQVRYLERMLRDLGMKGRMTLQQAKEIKDKRELAQELADVQEFAKKVKSRSSKSKGDDTSSPDEEEKEVPTKRKGSMRQSIMALVDEESD